MNLKDQKRYRVFIDESYDAEKEPGKSKKLWQYLELRGKRGVVYPYSSRRLAVLVSSPTIANRMKKDYPALEIIQDGAEETVFLLADNDFQFAAQAIKAFKRRTASPEAAERLAKYRFKGKTHAQ